MSGPAPLTMAVIAVPSAVAGGVTGALTRRWVASLSRGADLPTGWCVAGVGGLWAGTVPAWAAGVVPGAVVPLLLGLGWFAVTATLVDLTVRRLPDAVTLPAVPAVLVLLAPLGAPAVLRGLGGAMLLWAVHAMVRLVAPSAMGGGDVKAAAPVGAALCGSSWAALAAGTVTAAVLTAVAGVVARAVSRRAVRGRAAAGRVAVEHAVPQRKGPRRRAAVPHGPSMTIACLVTVAAAAAWPSAVGPG